MANIQRSHLDNAPLIRTELRLLWGDEKNTAVISHLALKELLSKGIHDVEYERTVLSDDPESDSDSYRASYSINDSRYSWLLLHGELRLISDDTYQTWSGFRSESMRIVRALNDMMQAQSDHIRLTVLRYVDRFRPDHFAGGTARSFLREDLGLPIAAPRRIGVFRDPDEVGCFYDFSRRIRTDLAVDLNIGEADLFGSGQSVICDVSVYRHDIDASADLASVLDEIHGVADSVFFDLIEPIQDRFRGGELS
ncbi:hypothetical protein Uis1B_2225 [Bifidobacterium margollesii]|uniref:TIGR04255 family protein n=1 Tax=Bifidobacterium margollesii TaxID=2020964 RepID=A0A2N5J6Z7_9BIFI|nr:TIGR04255 family protein [Bifidobacterium margollesii]PLS29957.1 hypothetical protein Uis1B_2225 [Bifidobacterium margollesii]